MGELGKLKGLGPASEKRLNEIGIFTRRQLEETGAVRAFIRLQEQSDTTPSLNFLYAMVGALANRHWSEIAGEERERLIFELEGIHDLERIMKSEGTRFE